MSQLFFGYFAGMIAITSILVVALRNPVYSALSLLVMFFHVAGLFITLHAEFLAAVQIIVYAGAILVLYLFVVMILNVKQDDRYHSQWRIAGFVCIPLLIESVMLLSGGAGTVNTGTRSLESERNDQHQCDKHIDPKQIRIFRESVETDRATDRRRPELR